MSRAACSSSHAVGEHRLDHLIVGDRPAGDDAALGELGRFLDEPGGGAAAARGDHQALAPEPGMGEAHAVALAADAVGGRDPDILEGEDRVMVIVGVGIER